MYVKVTLIYLPCAFIYPKDYELALLASKTAVSGINNIKEIQKMDYGHWVGIKFNPADHLGFVYVITNLISGRQYIGQKQLHSTIKKPPLKGKVNKRHSRKESEWRTYTGSSVSLNLDILNLGKENFKFEIVGVYDSKWELSYAEYSKIIAENAIPSRAYYNEFLGKIGKCPEKAKF